MFSSGVQGDSSYSSGSADVEDGTLQLPPPAEPGDIQVEIPNLGRITRWRRIQAATKAMMMRMGFSVSIISTPDKRAIVSLGNIIESFHRPAMPCRLAAILIH
jgi:hypothetical protein